MMRRYRCIIPFNGAVVEALVPHAATTGGFTVDALLRQLPTPEYQQQAGVPFRIDLLTTGSAAFGEPRGLGPDDALPDVADTQCHLVLLFDQKYMDRFPLRQVDSTDELKERQRRQLVVLSIMLAPLRQYIPVVRSDLDRASRFLGAITDEVVKNVQCLDRSLEVLRATPQVTTPDESLADRIGNVQPTIQAGDEELQSARATLDRAAKRIGDVERAFADEEQHLPAVEADATEATTTVLNRSVEQRLKALKMLLKSADACRRDTSRATEAVKAVRDGVLIKLLMLNGLPTAYAAAITLSRRRLVFNRAAQRVRQMLGVEHTALCDATVDFVAQHGSKFPTNLIPGIHSKPPLPNFEDPVADFVRDAPSMHNLDEDPASELLVHLGLLRAARPPTASHAQSESSEAANSTISALRAELQALQAATVAMRADLSEVELLRTDNAQLSRGESVLRSRCADAEAKLLECNAANEELRDTLRARELEAVAMRDALSKLQAELDQNRNAAGSVSSAAAAVAGGVVVNHIALLQAAERQRAEAVAETVELRKIVAGLNAQLSHMQDQLDEQAKTLHDVVSTRSLGNHDSAVSLASQCSRSDVAAPDSAAGAPDAELDLVALKDRNCNGTTKALNMQGLKADVFAALSKFEVITFAKSEGDIARGIQPGAFVATVGGVLIVDASEGSKKRTEALAGRDRYAGLLVEVDAVNWERGVVRVRVQI